MTDVQIGLPRPTDFATVQYFVQLPPTREMQGIVGQASDFVEVVSKID